MSDDVSKEKRSRRIYNDGVKAKRQKDILKAYGADFKPFESANYYAKRHALNCGNSNCVLCGNPRKFFGEKTVQEKRFEQAYTDEE